MGISSSAYLIWGIPVTSEDEHVWNAEAYEGEGDWREFGEELRVEPYGHYEDPDSMKGILTSTRIDSFTGDCWDPTRIGEFDLSVSDKVPSKANDEARVHGLPFDFYSDAGWHLVASVG